MNVTIYHNPRCSKSRATLELLHSKKCEIEIIEYLKDPPTKYTLKKILKKLGIGPNQLIRRSEPEFREKQLEKTSQADEKLLEAMISSPILIERPIVISPKGAAIGRPPENILKII